MTPRRLSICFVAHNAYGALNGGQAGHVGGVEWQTTIMARWLAGHGHEVSVITWNEGQPAITRVDGIQIVSLCRADAGLAGVRFVHPRWTSLVRALRTAQADLYYHNGGEGTAGQVALWCRCRRRRFVFSIASDADIYPNLPGVAGWHARLLYRLGLRWADRIVAQTHVQREALRQHFGRDAAVLPMPCPGPSDADYVQRSSGGNPPRILWVGRITPVKRLEWLLDVAAQCPDLTFEVVGPCSDPRYMRDLAARAGSLSNVRFEGRVSREHMPRFYTSATCLCCTSTHEGFPNTFLEAWSHGLPVVSTVDVDNAIRDRKLGIAVNSVPGLVAGIRSLLAPSSLWLQTSVNARNYYSRNHGLDEAMLRFAVLFETLAAEPAR